jgi:hypothetical protein
VLSERTLTATTAFRRRFAEPNGIVSASGRGLDRVQALVLWRFNRDTSAREYDRLMSYRDLRGEDDPYSSQDST